ncbi:MAG: hypothetical protein R2688_08070 [Fimbriimonadaceae bacterium]
MFRIVFVVVPQVRMRPNREGSWCLAQGQPRIQVVESPLSVATADTRPINSRDCSRIVSPDTPELGRISTNCGVVKTNRSGCIISERDLQRAANVINVESTDVIDSRVEGDCDYPGAIKATARMSIGFDPPKNVGELWINELPVVWVIVRPPRSTPSTLVPSVYPSKSINDEPLVMPAAASHASRSAVFPAAFVELKKVTPAKALFGRRVT